MAGKNGTLTAALEADCACGNLSIGDATASLGLSFERKSLSLAKADRVLVGHRLAVTLTAQEDGAELDQQALPGMEQQITLDATVDVKRIGVSAKRIGCNLAFALEDVDVTRLAQFARKSGRLTVASVEEIPEKARVHKEEGKTEEEAE